MPCSLALQRVPSVFSSKVPSCESHDCSCCRGAQQNIPLRNERSPAVAAVILCKTLRPNEENFSEPVTTSCLVPSACFYLTPARNTSTAARLSCFFLLCTVFRCFLHVGMAVPVSSRVSSWLKYLNDRMNCLEISHRHSCSTEDESYWLCWSPDFASGTTVSQRWNVSEQKGAKPMTFLSAAILCRHLVERCGVKVALFLKNIIIIVNFTMFVGSKMIVLFIIVCLTLYNKLDTLEGQMVRTTAVLWRECNGRGSCNTTFSGWILSTTFN